MNHYEFTTIRSNRKTIAIEVSHKGILVRAPQRMPDTEIAAFLQEKEAWIQRTLQKIEQRKGGAEEPLTPADIQDLAEKALKIIPEKVKYYAVLLNVDYGRITIRNQRTRWGSCSSNGNLSFNCLLMLMPDEVIDSVVAHELCHRKHMNHSAAFYAELTRVFPDYQGCRTWLKENGGRIMSRLP
jgi:predicted metal-dependent hydrolase